MGRASSIHTRVSQALVWGLPQAPRRAFERAPWVQRGWFMLGWKCVTRGDGQKVLLGCCKVALKGSTLVVRANRRVRQLCGMTSQRMTKAWG